MESDFQTIAGGLKNGLKNETGLLLKGLNLTHVMQNASLAQTRAMLSDAVRAAAESGDASAAKRFETLASEFSAMRDDDGRRASESRELHDKLVDAIQAAIDGQSIPHGHLYPGVVGCEKMCEGEHVTEDQCGSLANGACAWEDGRCWSKVGPNECDKYVAPIAEDPKKKEEEDGEKKEDGGYAAAAGADADADATAATTTTAAAA